MKAFGSCASRLMRVLSPRIEPPVRFEVGSTASTATRWPAATRFMPNWSMVVDLPTPGTPVTPRRSAPPLAGSSACSSFWAVAECSGLVLSTSVMARASMARSPERTPSI